jgi:hypothetical protein
MSILLPRTTKGKFSGSCGLACGLWEIARAPLNQDLNVLRVVDDVALED